MVKSSRLDAVLFDYDGTIANTDQLHFDCWNQMLAAYAVSIERAYYAVHCVGATSAHIAARIASDHGIDVSASAAMAARKDALYEAAIAVEPVPLMPGMHELLELLARHSVVAAVVTGAPSAAIRRTLDDHGIADAFRIFVTREDVTVGKPDPQSYLLGLQRLGVAADRAVALEDTASGIRAAKAAGLWACAIPHAFTHDHDFSSADTVVHDLRHAAERIGERFVLGP